jgi:tetratricopeptide (TPR) repeat protein
LNEQAEHYNKQGVRLLQAGELLEAIEFFSKAIELDPSNINAYKNRGETYLSLNRIVEGNTDIQKAKDLYSGKIRPKRANGPAAKISLNEIDSIYDAVFPEDVKDSGNDPLEFDNSLYDYVFSDDTIENEGTWDRIVQPAPETNSFPAILEFIGGKRLEVAGVIVFKPTNKDISLTRQDGHVERVIPLEQMGCIRIAGMPEGLAKEKNSSCHIEIIETIDSNIYHEAIHPDQNLENVLFGFSTKEQTRFNYSLIPLVNIRKRCQQRFLGDILLEKRFIANDMLKRALDEHQQTKNMKLGKILAQKAHVLYSTIEEELEKAKQEGSQGLKTGEILLTAGLVNEEQVLEALEYQENMQNMKIGEFLIEKGIIQEKEVYIALAEKFRIPFIDLRKQKVSKKTLTLLSRNIVLQNEILPIWLKNGVLKVATLRPDIAPLCEAIIKDCKCQEVIFVLAQPTHLRNIINLLYKKIGLGR